MIQKDVLKSHRFQIMQLIFMIAMFTILFMMTSIIFTAENQSDIGTSAYFVNAPPEEGMLAYDHHFRKLF